MAKISIDLIPREEFGIKVGVPTETWDSGKITDKFLFPIFLTCTLTLRKLGRAHKLIEVISVRFLEWGQLSISFKIVVVQPHYSDIKGEVKYQARSQCPILEKGCAGCNCDNLHSIDPESVSDELVRLIKSQIGAFIGQATASFNEMNSFLSAQPIKAQ